MPSTRLVKTMAALTVVVLGASGCSDDPKASNDASASGAASKAPASIAGAPDAPAATVADTCAAISPAMQQIPGKGPYKEIVDLLEPVIVAGGDPATAFEGLYQAASKAVETIGTVDYLDVEAEFDSLLPGVASTCESAGAPL